MRLNFLTLSDRTWRLACINPQNYQNHLRHSDYLTVFREAGYTLLHVDDAPDPKARADVDRLAHQPRFIGYDKDDLAVLTTVLVARRPQ